MAQNLKINILAQDKTKQAFNGIKGKLAGLKSAVFSLRGAFVTLGAGLAVKSFVSTGRSIEDLNVRLKQLFGSTQEGAKAFDVMANFAAKVPFSLEQIQEASGNLAVVAGDADSLAKILEITGNVAAVTGIDFRTAGEQIQRSFAGGISAADIFREKGVRDMLGFKAGATVSAEETVKAFDNICKKIDINCKLVFNSQADIKKNLNNVFAPWLYNMIQDNPKIEYILGSHPHPGIYHYGDIYVYPSKLEGIGLSIPEALSCGLAVITTDNPPMKEFIESGNNGFLVKITGSHQRHDNYYWPEVDIDIKHLEDLMMYYVNNPSIIELHKTNARNYALEKLTWANNTDYIIDLFKKLLN